MLLKTVIKTLCSVIPNKNFRRSFRKRLELSCGCLDLAEYFIYYHSVYHKHKLLEERKDRIDTLILGDSHAQFGVYPVLLGENVYNYAFNANGLYEDFEALKQAASLCSLKKVILVVSFFDGAFCEVMGESFWKCLILHRLFCFPYDFSVSKNKQFVFYDKIIKKLSPETSKCYSQGFDYVGMSVGVPAANSRKRILKHCQLASKYDNQWVWLEKICEYCQEHQLELIVVNSPEREDYKKMTDELIDRKKILLPVNEICARHNLSFLENVDFFVTEDFADCDHLNINGAIKFTKFIKNYI